MGKQKTQERNQARDLYVNSGLTLKEAAAIVKVAASHVGRWAKEDNWDVQRTAQQVTAEKIIAGWYSQLQKINEEVAKGETRITEDGKTEVVRVPGIPSNAQADQISKITDSIQKLSKKQNLSMYHAVLKEFLNELLTIDTDAAKSFGPYMLDFMKRKASQLANDL
ncbi:MAG: DUF1804 family protein [Ginsengibacter sp.]